MNKMVRAHYNVRVAKFIGAFDTYVKHYAMGSMITPDQFSERVRLWNAALAARKELGAPPPHKKQAPV